MNTSGKWDATPKATSRAEPVSAHPNATREEGFKTVATISCSIRVISRLPLEPPSPLVVEAVGRILVGAGVAACMTPNAEPSPNPPCFPHFDVYNG